MHPSPIQCKSKPSTIHVYLLHRSCTLPPNFLLLPTYLTHHHTIMHLHQLHHLLSTVWVISHCKRMPSPHSQIIKHNTSKKNVAKLSIVPRFLVLSPTTTTHLTMPVMHYRSQTKEASPTLAKTILLSTFGAGGFLDRLGHTTFYFVQISLCQSFTCR